jgi:hypothetical protein
VLDIYSSPSMKLNSLLRKTLRLFPDYIAIVIYYFAFNKRVPNLSNPTTLNEKILWLKLNDRRDWHSRYADKIQVKDVIRKAVGDEFNIPLIACFKDIVEAQSEIENICPPFILKPNHDSGGGYIVKEYRDLQKIDWAALDKRLRTNYFQDSLEYQYRYVEPCLMVEVLLQDKYGRIPNDYKIHVFNSRAQFVYCSIDRFGENYRKIYDRDWIKLDMEWGSPEYSTSKSKYDGPDIPAPQNFRSMVQLAEKLSVGFCYLRVDLYEIDGKVYVGELTQHQYGGYLPIVPYQMDEFWGSKLNLEVSTMKSPY